MPCCKVLLLADSDTDTWLNGLFRSCYLVPCRDVTALSVLAMLLMDEFAEEEEAKLRVLEEQEEEVSCKSVVTCSLSLAFAGLTRVLSDTSADNTLLVSWSWRRWRAAGIFFRCAVLSLISFILACAEDGLRHSYAYAWRSLPTDANRPCSRRTEPQYNSD